MRFVLCVLSGLVLLGSDWLPVWVAHSASALQRALPELIYTCPMHPDVLEAKAGSCPICKMKTEPVRIEEEFWYACPIHAATLGPSPGVCPLDKRQKMPVVVTVHWICDENSSQKLMEPGRCADGSARQEIHQIRAHGDHNPRHGGQFYMAADNWHHVEGTYPRRGLFRVYFYDNFTQPIDPKAFTARIIGNGQADVLLKPGRGTTMEAGVNSEALPLKVTVRVKFNDTTPESQFDFAFDELSKEPAPSSPPSRTAVAIRTPPDRAARAPAAAASAGRVTRPAAPVGNDAATRPPAATAGAATAVPTIPAPAPVATAPAAPTLTNCEPNVSRTDVLLLSETLPKDPKSLLGLLAMCRSQVQTLIENGQFGFVYQPTMLGKDIALALEEHVGTLPRRRQSQADDAIRRAVLSAWQLDLYGDLGNQAKLTDAYNLFAAAIADITVAYGAQP